MGVYERKYADYYSYVGDAGYFELSGYSIPLMTETFIADVVTSVIQQGLEEMGYGVLHIIIKDEPAFYKYIPVTKYTIGVSFFNESRSSLIVWTAGTIALVAAGIAAILITSALLVYVVAEVVYPYVFGEPDTPQPGALDNFAQMFKSTADLVKWGSIGLIGVGGLLLASEFTSIKGVSKAKKKVMKYAV